VFHGDAVCGVQGVGAGGVEDRPQEVLPRVDDAPAGELVVEQVPHGGAVQLCGRSGQSTNGRVGADGLQPDCFVLQDLAGGLSGGGAAGDEVADLPQAPQIGGDVAAMPACGAAAGAETVALLSRRA
jgi:hypothetical protein